MKFKKHLDIFQVGSDKVLIDHIQSVMMDSNDEENRIWMEFANEFVESYVPILVWKRDYQDMSMDIDNFDELCFLTNVIKFSKDPLLSTDMAFKIQNYLNKISGYRSEFFYNDGSPNIKFIKNSNIEVASIYQGHAHRTMQFKRVFEYLGKEDGFKFNSDIELSYYKGD
jgi:hypothetical protein